MPDLSILTTPDRLNHADPVPCIRLLTEGLARQTAPRDRWELVVVDDRPASDDPALAALLAEFGEHHAVQRVRSARAGRAAALNKAADAAAGPVLCFLASDFRPRPGFVAAHAGLHENGGSAEDAGSRVGVGPSWFPDQPWRSPFMEWLDRTGRTFGARFLEDRMDPPGFVYAANASMHRDLFFKVGPFIEALDQSAGDDAEWSERAHAHGMRVVYLPDAAVDHIHKVSLQDRCLQVERAGRARARWTAAPFETGSRARGPFPSGAVGRRVPQILADAWHPRRTAWALRLAAASLRGYAKQRAALRRARDRALEDPRHADDAAR